MRKNKGVDGEEGIVAKAKKMQTGWQDVGGKNQTKQKQAWDGQGQGQEGKKKIKLVGVQRQTKQQGPSSPSPHPLLPQDPRPATMASGQRRASLGPAEPVDDALSMARRRGLDASERRRGLRDGSCSVREPDRRSEVSIGGGAAKRRGTTGGVSLVRPDDLLSLSSRPLPLAHPPHTLSHPRYIPISCASPAPDAEAAPTAGQGEGAGRGGGTKGLPVVGAGGATRTAPRGWERAKPATPRRLEEHEAAAEELPGPGRAPRPRPRSGRRQDNGITTLHRLQDAARAGQNSRRRQMQMQMQMQIYLCCIQTSAAPLRPASPSPS